MENFIFCAVKLATISASQLRIQKIKMEVFAKIINGRMPLILDIWQGFE